MMQSVTRLPVPLQTLPGHKGNGLTGIHFQSHPSIYPLLLLLLSPFPLSPVLLTYVALPFFFFQNRNSLDNTRRHHDGDSQLTSKVACISHRPRGQQTATNAVYNRQSNLFWQTSNLTIPYRAINI